MFRKIIDYFTGMKHLLEQNNELARLARREGQANRRSDEAFRDSITQKIETIENNVAALNKIISSLEIEVILLRKGQMAEDGLRQPQ